MSSDFNKDNDFDGFDDSEFDDFKSRNTLADIWAQPVVKIIAVILGLIAFIILLVILLSEDKTDKSRLGFVPDQREAPGGEVSQSYAKALEDVNTARLEEAEKNPDKSAIPIPFNLQDEDLLSEVPDAPPYDDFDPLAAWKQQAVPEEEDPVLKEEDPVLEPYQGPIAPQPAPGPSPQVVTSLAQAMSQQMGDIVGAQNILAPQIMQVTANDYFEVPIEDIGLIDTNGDGIPDSPAPNLSDDDEVIETILLPAGTINYAQMMMEANSDVPGPILARLVSGPLAGAKLIGTFDSTGEHLILTFNSIVIDGINQDINAVAIDPNTTLPGVATEVDQRYWSRVLLPAAAKFIEGVGSGIARESSTTVTVTGGTTTTSTEDLDLEQELGLGAEKAAEEIADFMDREADKIEPLVRVAKGTPVGIFFTQPVIEGEN